MDLFRKVLIFTILLMFQLSYKLSAQVVINEYSCSNISTIVDNYGEYNDWLEIYNPSSSAVSLSGYYLSDKSSKPDKWMFPAGVSVPANGF